MKDKRYEQIQKYLRCNKSGCRSNSHMICDSYCVGCSMLKNMYLERKLFLAIVIAAKHGLELGHWGEGSSSNWIRDALEAWELNI